MASETRNLLLGHLLMDLLGLFVFLPWKTLGSSTMTGKL